MTTLPEDFRQYLIRRNVKWQRPVVKNLIWLESSMALQNPSWTPHFIGCYLISHYGDIWQYWTKLRTDFYRLTERDRHRYRVRLVTEEKLCPDIVTYLEGYF